MDVHKAHPFMLIKSCCLVINMHPMQQGDPPSLKWYVKKNPGQKGIFTKKYSELAKLSSAFLNFPQLSLPFKSNIGAPQINFIPKKSLLLRGSNQSYH